MSISNYDGLYVGLLTPEELEEFNRWCKDGKASRSYEGAAGFIGLPKVRIGHTDCPYSDRAALKT